MPNRSLLFSATLAFLFLPACESQAATTNTPLPSPPSTNAARNREIQALLKEAGCLAQSVEKHIEDWGIITVSEPLVLKNAGQFSLGAEADFPKAAAYITKAESGVQGAAAQSVEQALNVKAAANVSPPGIPAAIPALPASPAASPSAAPLSLLAGSGSLGISERQAIQIGLNDKITELLIRSMANPKTDELASEQNVYFGIVQISCNPGRRTKSDYIGEVSVSFEYLQGQTLSLSTDSRPQPMVYGVLPLIDAQTLDLRNSNRWLFSVVAQLAASMPSTTANTSGQGLVDFVDRVQRDLGNRTAQPVVNSYSSGTTFGFRFAPSFQALQDPAQSRSRAGHVLIPTTFPALVILGMNKQDIKDGGPKGYTDLVTHVSYDWYLRDGYKKRDTLASRLQLADKVQRLYDLNSRLRDDLHLTITDLRFASLRKKLFNLEFKSLGKSSISPLPKDVLVVQAPEAKAARITGITPKTLNASQGNTFVISGVNLNTEVKQIWLGGNLLEIKQKVPINTLGGEKSEDNSVLIATASPGSYQPDMKSEGTPSKAFAYPVLISAGGAVLADAASDVKVEILASPAPEPMAHEITLSEGPTVTTLKVQEKGKMATDKLPEIVGEILKAALQSAPEKK